MSHFHFTGSIVFLFHSIQVYYRTKFAGLLVPKWEKVLLWRYYCISCFWFLVWFKNQLNILCLKIKCMTPKKICGLNYIFICMAVSRLAVINSFRFYRNISRYDTFTANHWMYFSLSHRIAENNRRIHYCCVKNKEKENISTIDY